MVATEPVGDQGMPSEPGFVNGGMFARQTNFPTTPVITIDVDDIDAALADIETRAAARQSRRSSPSATWGSPPTARAHVSGDMSRRRNAHACR